MSNIELVVALERSMKRPENCVGVSDWDSVLTPGTKFGYVESKHR